MFFLLKIIFLWNPFHQEDSGENFIERWSILSIYLHLMGGGAMWLAKWRFWIFHTFGLGSRKGWRTKFDKVYLLIPSKVQLSYWKYFFFQNSFMVSKIYWSKKWTINSSCLKIIWNSFALFYLNKTEKRNISASLNFCIVYWKQWNCLINVVFAIFII